MTDNDLTNKGLTRREVLLGLGAAAVLSMVPSKAQAIALDADVWQGKPRGVIFLVGDGMPLGVV
jgi:alkaline phosphatase